VAMPTSAVCYRLVKGLERCLLHPVATVE
jgi:hypothetical protein